MAGPPHTVVWIEPSALLPRLRTVRGRSCGFPAGTTVSRQVIANSQTTVSGLPDSAVEMHTGPEASFFEPPKHTWFVRELVLVTDAHGRRNNLPPHLFGSTVMFGPVCIAAQYREAEQVDPEDYTGQTWYANATMRDETLARYWLAES